tara:strand:- start:78 stop:1487 length:1410 start_codon:yes stop_codon:yes gene_type:complete
MSNRDKLKRFQDQAKKAYAENVNEVVDELQFERDMADPSAISGMKSLNAIRRAIRQEIPDSTRKWLEASGNGDLWPAYKKWVKEVAKQKNRLASTLANELGLDLEKEHWTPVAGMGDIPPKMPFTSVSDRGPDSEGGTGSGKFNRRVGNKPVFRRRVLQQLGVATNWQESVSNFVADRPDIKDVAERKNLNLQPLPVRKASNLALLKLQQKDLTGNQLESMMDLEYDLKKSGLISSKNDESLLNNYLDNINTKETAMHAQKHSWKRNNKGELILDQNNKPIPSGQWDLNTKEAHRSTNEWFTKRKADSINAVKRGNPKFTKLKIGAGLLGATNFLPTKASAEQIKQEISEGKIGDATQTYGKDLIVGQATSRTATSLLKLAQSKLSKSLKSQLTRQVLKFGGRQLAKKGAALATGPLAPAVMTGLIIKDVYDVANVISGDKLKFSNLKKNSEMSREERFKAIDNIKFIK